MDRLRRVLRSPPTGRKRRRGWTPSRYVDEAITAITAAAAMRDAEAAAEHLSGRTLFPTLRDQGRRPHRKPEAGTPGRGPDPPPSRSSSPITGSRRPCCSPAPRSCFRTTRARDGMKLAAAVIELNPRSAPTWRPAALVVVECRNRRPQDSPRLDLHVQPEPGPRHPDPVGAIEAYNTPFPVTVISDGVTDISVRGSGRSERRPSDHRVEAGPTVRRARAGFSRTDPAQAGARHDRRRHRDRVR